MLEGLVDVSVGDEVLVDDSPEEGREDGVEDDVGRVEESHDGTESRDVLVSDEVHVGERSLNVS